MLNISKLTTKKTKCVYIIVYIIYSLLYLLNPILIMKFIDYIVDKNIDYALIFALYAFINFVLIQLFGFLLSICVGKVERENYIIFYLKIYSITKENCCETNSPSLSSLSQYMGEYYEKSNAYFFVQKVELIFSIINIISIFIVMFILDYRIAFILLIFVPISFLITKKFEKKLYYNAGKNIKNSDQIKKFILDQKII